VVTTPVQVVPLSANEVGTGLAPLHPPTKPTEVEAPVVSDPFQPMLAADTRLPDCVQVALHPWVTVCPAFGKSNVSVQLVMAEPRLVMPTSAVNPPGHWLCTLYMIEQPVAAADAGRAAVARPPSTSAPVAPAASSV